MSAEQQMVKQFIATSLWTHEAEDIDVDEIPQDLKDKTLKVCEEFLQSIGEAAFDYDITDLGHDLMLTGAGHGAGFWDGDYPIHGDFFCEKTEPLKDEIVDIDDEIYMWVEGYMA